MGFYDRHILPRLIDLAMHSRVLDRHRRRAVALARGCVLEIGVGSGPNLALYGPEVERLCAIDPSPELLRLAGERSTEARVPVSLVRASAELLPFLDAIFDTVVTTWTLCSVADPALALSETRRVLKPGGRLVFVEHGLAPEPGVARWQRGLTPCWMHIAGGCHLDRRIDDLVRAAGFRLDALETGYIKGPKPWTFLYHGWASA
jgi:ubiquinone/menaquinone biosynthesis C-methylase UbiE